MNKILEGLYRSVWMLIIVMSNAENISMPAKAEAIRNKTLQENTQNRSESIAQIVRRIIDLPQIVAAGGSRSEANRNYGVCLIAPPVEENSKPAKAITTIPRPIIVTSSTLSQIRIWNAKRSIVLYEESASLTNNIQTPIPWPLKDIQPGEQFILELRKSGAPRTERAKVILEGSHTIATQQLFKKRSNQTKVLELEDAISKMQALDPKLILNLIFTINNSESKALLALRNNIKNRGCSYDEKAENL